MSDPLKNPTTFDPQASSHALALPARFYTDAGMPALRRTRGVRRELAVRRP
jgi:hypothetical protein